MSAIEGKFLETFGVEPDLVAAAPGRVNLIGEHIDYSEGFVLPFAIKDRTLVAVRKRDDSTVRIASAQRRNKIVTVDIKNVKPGLKGEWERYALGVLWSMGVKSGVDLMIDGHVPLGAGLSSSAALECSVATAMNHLFDMGFNLEELARLTQKLKTSMWESPAASWINLFPSWQQLDRPCYWTAEIFQPAIFHLMLHHTD